MTSSTRAVSNTCSMDDFDIKFYLSFLRPRAAEALAEEQGRNPLLI
jgi:hypothetical protein